MARKVTIRTHAERMAEMITEGALDSQISEESYEENEIANIISNHLRAGMPVEETGWTKGAKYVAPHNPEDHCPVCCPFDNCEG